MPIFTVSSLQKLKKKNNNCSKVIYLLGQELVQRMLVMCTGLTELYEVANRIPDLPVEVSRIFSLFTERVPFSVRLALAGCLQKYFPRIKLPKFSNSKSRATGLPWSVMELMIRQLLPSQMLELLSLQALMLQLKQLMLFS